MNFNHLTSLVKEGILEIIPTKATGKAHNITSATIAETALTSLPNLSHQNILKLNQTTSDGSIPIYVGVMKRGAWYVVI